MTYSLTHQNAAADAAIARVGDVWNIVSGWQRAVEATRQRAAGIHDTPSDPLRPNRDHLCANPPPDPRIVAVIDQVLHRVVCVANIVAGTGSYEPSHTVLAVEPTRVMIDQRPTWYHSVIREFWLLREYVPAAAELMRPLRSRSAL